MTQVFDSIKQTLNVEGLLINILSEDIDSQTDGNLVVAFEDALQQAIYSLLNDGQVDESPLWVVENLPEEYGLSGCVDMDIFKNKVRELLNEESPILRLKTELESEQSQWQGKVICHSTDEIYGTHRYWIFELVNSPFSDISYVAIDKLGEKPSCCWGM